MQQDKIFHAIPTQRKKLSETKWSHRTFKLLISYSAVIFVLQIKCGFDFQLGNTTITFVSLTLLAIEHLKAGQCGVTLILSSTHTCRLLNYNLKEYLSNEEGHFSLFASSLIIWRSWMMMGFGSVIWRAHHRAVQSFLVVAARSFRATTTNKVSVKKNTLGHATWNMHTTLSTTTWITSVLCEIRSLPLVLGHVHSLLLTSCLCDTNGHIILFQGCVDVCWKGSTT